MNNFQIYWRLMLIFTVVVSLTDLIFVNQCFTRFNVSRLKGAVRIFL